MPIDIETAKELSATKPLASFDRKKYREQYMKEYLKEYMKEYNMNLYRENREEILQYMKDRARKTQVIYALGDLVLLALCWLVSLYLYTRNHWSIGCLI